MNDAQVFLSGTNLDKDIHHDGIDDNVYSFINTGNVGIGVTSPSSKLQVNGSLSLPVVTKTSTYTAGADDYLIMGNTQSASFDIDLPQASTCPGRIFVIKKIHANYSLNIDPYAGDTVDVSDPFALTANNATLMIQSDGANTWRIISLI